MSLASLEELKARLPRAVSASDELRAETALDDASVLVLDASGEEWTSETVPDVVKVVVLNAARRAFLNPEELVSEALGDYSRKRAAASVFLTREEKHTIRKAAGKSGVSTIDLFGDLPVSEDFTDPTPFDIEDES